TFLVVYSLAQWYDKSTISSLLLASLAMATSPAGILRVINEQQSSGQVTERVLHLTAINCVLAVFTFKIISGFWLFAKSGSLWQAISNSLLMLILSTALGGLFGVLVPNIMRRLDSLARDVTVAFAIAIILIVAITQVTNLSPVLASLTFGLMARHMRVAMNKTQRNFGALGELLTMMLFMVVATTLDWQKVVAGFGLACLLVSARWLTKVALVAVFSHYSSISWLKGVLTGMALAPISVFAILMLAQTKYLGKTLITDLAPLAAMALLLEIIGPILTHFALVWAKETLISTKRS
ncbi:MAG: cation:proton antiporter, partial [Burkholderiales bacterium]